MVELRYSQYFTFRWFATFYCYEQIQHRNANSIYKILEFNEANACSFFVSLHFIIRVQIKALFTKMQSVFSYSSSYSSIDWLHFPGNKFNFCSFITLIGESN